MSNTAVQEFLAKIPQDQALQEEIANLLQQDVDGGYSQVVSKLANARGYDFTADELKQEIERRQAEFQDRQESGELTDEELEAVAGGEVFFVTLATAVVTVTATVIKNLAHGRDPFHNFW